MLEPFWILYDPAADVTQLLGFLKKEGILKNKLAVPTAEGMEFIEITSVVYCESQRNYTKVYTLDVFERLQGE